MSAKVNLIVGGEPRVELLPAEVGKRARAAASRRLGVLLLVLVILVVGAGIGYAYLRNHDAQSQLAAARAETDRIVLEQQKYTEAAAVSGLIAGVEEFETVSTSNEILWAEIVDELLASIDPNVALVSYDLNGWAPWQPPAAPTGVLRGESVAHLTLVITTPTVFDAATVARVIGELPWNADVTIDSAIAGGGYLVTLSIGIDSDALALRFAEGGTWEGDGLEGSTSPLRDVVTGGQGPKTDHTEPDTETQDEGVDP